MMYGKMGTQRNNMVFGEVVVTYAKMEYGVLSAKFFCLMAKNVALTHLVKELELKYVMDKGDSLYEEEASEDPHASEVRDIKAQLKEIVCAALQHFKYYTEFGNINKDALSDTDDKDYLESELTPQKENKMESNNYNKKEVRNIERNHNSTHVLEDSNSAENTEDKNKLGDDDLSVTAQILTHRNYMKPISSKTTMCSTRAAMESIAYRSQQRQAEKINVKHSQDKTYKQVLEVGDIGVIYVQPKTRNSCDHPFLPVMITGTKISQNSI